MLLEIFINKYAICWNGLGWNGFFAGAGGDGTETGWGRAGVLVQVSICYTRSSWSRVKETRCDNLTLIKVGNYFGCNHCHP